MRFLRWFVRNSRWVLNSFGATFAVTYDFTANTVISSSNMNTNFADVETAINSIEDYIGTGVITNAMLAGSIDLTSKMTGVLPVANGGTEFDTGDICLSSAAKDESGWTEITSTYAGKYLRVGATGLATGGAATHTHAAGSYVGASHTHTVSWSVTTCASSDADGYLMATTTNTPNISTHKRTTAQSSITSAAGGTGAITGTSAAGVNTPVYCDMRLFQKS